MLDCFSHTPIHFFFQQLFISFFCSGTFASNIQYPNKVPACIFVPPTQHFRSSFPLFFLLFFLPSNVPHPRLPPPKKNPFILPFLSVNTSRTLHYSLLSFVFVYLFLLFFLFNCFNIFFPLLLTLLSFFYFPFLLLFLSFTFIFFHSFIHSFCISELPHFPFLYIC